MLEAREHRERLQRTEEEVNNAESSFSILTIKKLVKEKSA